MPQEDIEEQYRRCQVYLNERDEVAFSRVLRELCPQTVFFENDRRGKPEFDSIIPNIAHSRTDCVDITMPSPGQEQSWRSPRDRQEMIESRICRFSYERSRWLWHLWDRPMKFDPPEMEHGQLVAFFPAHDDTMKKFALKVLRLTRKITWGETGYGLAACRWSQSGGPVRRIITGSKPIDPSEDIRLNKYYDDAGWDDRLPDEPTIPGYEYLEWHRLPVRRPPLDPNDR